MKRTSPERSHVMQSNRTSTLILWVVVVFVVGSVAGPQRAAATHGIPFFDDFSDMNFSDDMPVSWIPGAGVILDASSGDLVLTSAPPRAGAFAGGDPNVVGGLPSMTTSPFGHRFGSCRASREAAL